MTTVLPERPAALFLTSHATCAGCAICSVPAGHPDSCSCGACTTGTGSADLMVRLAAVPGGRTAVVGGDRELTFAELRTEAAAFAAGLAARGLGRESLVALCLPRGADLAVAIIGALTAGAAYLPVDPALPEERRRYLVEDSAADLVVVPESASGSQVSGAAPALTPAALTARRAGAEDGFAPEPVTAGTLAYVIYTSGSTGRPKGVEIGRGAASLLLRELEGVGAATGQGRRVGWNASPSFDASVQQWIRLCRGDTLVMIDEETRRDPSLLAAFIDAQALTDLDITPSHADPLLDLLTGDGGPRPLTLLVGGEPIGPPCGTGWRPRTAPDCCARSTCTGRPSAPSTPPPGGSTGRAPRTSARPCRGCGRCCWTRGSSPSPRGRPANCTWRARGWDAATEAAPG